MYPVFGFTITINLLRRFRLETCPRLLLTLQNSALTQLGRLRGPFPQNRQFDLGEDAIHHLQYRTIRLNLFIGSCELCSRIDHGAGMKENSLEDRFTETRPHDLEELLLALVATVEQGGQDRDPAVALIRIELGDIGMDHAKELHGA